MNRYKLKTLVNSNGTTSDFMVVHPEGEWLTHKEVSSAKKTKEFCMGVCCNRDEYRIFQEYGKECPNCPVDCFIDHYGLGEYE
jgi:hypothetical protein